MEENVKRNRVWAYNILINEFEPKLRETLIEKILIPNFGSQGWSEQIPKKVFTDLEESGKNIAFDDIYALFEELYLISLKEISINNKVYPLCKNVVYKDISKEIFISKFDNLNELRNRIAHAKSSFSDYEFESLIQDLESICSEETFAEFLSFLRNEQYKTTDIVSIPDNFYKQSTCINNLPSEDYELDGGYIGRKKEINDIKRMLYSDLDRVISITGAGGLGKTALALKTSYSILFDEKSPYKYIVWFSAKENKLTAENGIVGLESQITDYSTLLRDIADTILIDNDEDYEEYDDYDLKEEIYAHFVDNKSLLIIDNLETITDVNIINFIKDIPRPSQVLITSRKGLGEIERRYELTDFQLESAVQLFRILAKQKHKNDLLRLDNTTIEQLVTHVKCYPLLIKWSIGKTCLGMDINKAFNAIYSGKSEISQFVFNDIFALFSNNAKQVLYAMIVYGDKPISDQMLRHFVNFDDDEFTDIIKDLINCSFIQTEISDNNGQLITLYNMLFLTRGFIQTKLDGEDPSIRINLQNILHEININAEETTRTFIEYNKSLSTYGIQSEEDKLSYSYIKIAKNYAKQENTELAAKNFDKALQISPNLVYAINEVAKFKASIFHLDEAEELFKRGISINKNSLILSSYGIFLRKNDRFSEAIEYYYQALELNPENASVLTELGRALSFNTQYEEADKEFENALALKKLDFKQKRVAMYYKADNYHRWGETLFNQQGDIYSALHYYNLALDLIDECLEMNSFDKQVKTLKSKVTKDLGIIYLKQDNLNESEECFDIVINLGIVHDECIVIKELFKYYKRKDKNFANKIQHWIDKLQTNNLQPKEQDEINRLKDYVSHPSNKKIGLIRYINMHKRYGVIDYDYHDSCTFILKHANFFVEEKNKDDFNGKKVSFELKMYHEKLVGVNVDLEE